MVFIEMGLKLSNVTSNPLYHFVEVECTDDELFECTKWCYEQFGKMTHSHKWDFDRLDLEAAPERILSILRLRSKGLANPIKHRYRFRFPKLEHRDWFIVRWS